MSTRSIVAVSAGLSTPSSTRLLAERLGAAAVDSLEIAGETANLEVVELRDLAHSITDAMLTGFAAGELADVLDRVAGADGLVLSTPIFASSYSGLFKSFLDVVDRDSLQSMPVALGATGGTSRHSLALEHSVRPVLTYLRADVVTTSVFAATDDWAGTGGGQVGDDGLAARIRRAGSELADRVAARPARRTVQDPFGDVPSFETLLGS
ncbi:FMN reductase [Paraoerskovia marina]|uniref:FMN reductase n=1 Tax=Paraoerskovia marina TaxID=545619 RepID=A0A1H1RUP9_9CELL|nr:CE1759 family FMN reductase [Paraoerskovia marina]SDS39418.1 FMN reductase [Paraoerskovia marina]